jgi:flagellar biosynthesis GTPase FlhF
LLSQTVYSNYQNNNNSSYNTYQYNGYNNYGYQNNYGMYQTQTQTEETKEVEVKEEVKEKEEEKEEEEEVKEVEEELKKIEIEVKLEEEEESEKEVMTPKIKNKKKKEKKNHVKNQVFLNMEEWNKAEIICNKYEKVLKSEYKIEMISPCFVEKKVQIQIGVLDSTFIEKIPKILDHFKVSISLMKKGLSWFDEEDSSNDSQ